MTTNGVKTISFRVAEERVAALDSIAKAMDRDRSYLLNQAVERYLDEHRQFAELVERGREDLRRGRVFSHAEVEAKVDAWESPDILTGVR